MQVKVSFTLDVDPALWAGADADTMTTSDVAAEVQTYAYNIMSAKLAKLRSEALQDAR